MCDDREIQDKDIGGEVDDSQEETDFGGNAESGGFVDDVRVDHSRPDLEQIERRNRNLIYRDFDDFSDMLELESDNKNPRFIDWMIHTAVG